MWRQADAPRRRQPDVLATVYRHLGIDPETTLMDGMGKPVPVLSDGRPIRQLL